MHRELLNMHDHEERETERRERGGPIASFDPHPFSSSPYPRARPLAGYTSLIKYKERLARRRYKAVIS